MTSSATASGDSPKQLSLLGCVWRPGGLLYLAVVLVGLAVGLFPGAIAPAREGRTSVPLPALRCIAVAQVAYILLVYPLVVLYRAERNAIRRYWREVLLESLGLLVVTAPVYFAAAYLSDAVTGDVIRTVFSVACIWFFGFSLCKYIAAHRAGRWIVLLLLMIVAVGLPGIWYIVSDFLGPGKGADRLWCVSPAMFAWETARSRGGTWTPQPLWGVMIWLGLAVLGVLLDLLLPKTRKAPPQPPDA